jgi:4-alpha-glucanotransferase
MKKRASGILLHITCLPSRFGIGDMGPAARRFVDFLARSGQRYWQILPLNPTEAGGYHSPYHSFSAFAGNPLLISPEGLVEDGLLREDEIGEPPVFPEDRVDFETVVAYKEPLFQRAWERFMSGGPSGPFDQFLRENGNWIDDFARFFAIKTHLNGETWDRWPEGRRDRDPGAMAEADRSLGDLIRKARFLQFIFYRQWAALKAYANRRKIQILGDIPIYVNHDSADVWSHRELFKLDENNRPAAVSGVPPDYFSATGQLWGHPVYRWDVLRERCFDWWADRLDRNLALFNWVRLDHFRGLVSYWEVAAEEETAMNGRWVDVPSVDFFNGLSSRFSCLPIIAEDLGVITPDVREVMRRFGFPGMRLLHFAFGDDLPRNPYAPHNHEAECAAYTGTHDNNTTRGWFENDMPHEDRDRLFQYLGRSVPADEIAWELIRLVQMSPARLAVVPMQDLLNLGQEARMNQPATTDGNWQWRVRGDDLSDGLAERLLGVTRIYGRG